MSETRHHTPGPWTILGGYDDPYIVPLLDQNKPVGGAVDPSRDINYAKVIAVIRKSKYAKFYKSRVMLKEAKANARLIAAAPEMLAVLKRVAAFIGTRSNFESMVELIQTVITEAEGKA